MRSSSSTDSAASTQPHTPNSPTSWRRRWLRSLVSRTRLENASTGRYGAFYLFDSKVAFDGFVASELYGVAHGHAALAEVVASDFAISNGGGSPR